MYPRSPAHNRPYYATYERRARRELLWLGFFYSALRNVGARSATQSATKRARIRSRFVTKMFIDYKQRFCLKIILLLHLVFFCSSSDLLHTDPMSDLYQRKVTKARQSLNEAASVRSIVRSLRGNSLKHQLTASADADRGKRRPLHDVFISPKAIRESKKFDTGRSREIKVRFITKFSQIIFSFNNNNKQKIFDGRD